MKSEASEEEARRLEAEFKSKLSMPIDEGQRILAKARDLIEKYGTPASPPRDQSMSNIVPDAPDDEEENDIWCNECGEEDRISYVETNAECDVWKCRSCGNEFQTTRDEDED